MEKVKQNTQNNSIEKFDANTDKHIETMEELMDDDGFEGPQIGPDDYYSYPDDWDEEDIEFFNA